MQENYLIFSIIISQYSTYILIISEDVRGLLENSIKFTFRDCIQKVKQFCLVPTQHFMQGWEFAHWFSERIARFLPKNERMSDLLKK